MTPSQKLKIHLNINNLTDCNIFCDKYLAQEFALKKNYSLKLHNIDNLEITYNT